MEFSCCVFLLAVCMLSGRAAPTYPQLQNSGSSFRANLLGLLSASKGRVIRPSPPRPFVVNPRVATFGSSRRGSSFPDLHVRCLLLGDSANVFTSGALHDRSLVSTAAPASSLSSSASRHSPSLPSCCNQLRLSLSGVADEFYTQYIKLNRILLTIMWSDYMFSKMNNVPIYRQGRFAAYWDYCIITVL